RRILSRPYCQSDLADLGPAGRRDGRSRSQRVSGRMGGTDLDRIPRLESVRAAAQRTGHGNARDAEPDGAVSAGAVRLAESRGVAHRNRSAEAGLCGLETISGGPAIRESAGERNYFENVRGGAGEADRSKAGTL